MFRARVAAPLFAAAAVAIAGIVACASDPSCPAGAIQVASYTVSYTALDGGDTCMITRLADGGSTYQNLLATPAPSSMLLCASGIDAGTPQLSLASVALASSSTTTYAASSSTSDVTNTACLCNLTIGDTLSVTLATPDGGPVSFLRGLDGGITFSSVPTFTGQLDYSFQASSNNTVACACNLPCGAHYAMSATQ